MKISIISSSIRKGRNTHSVALALQQQLEKREGLSVELIDLLEVNLPMMTERLQDMESPSETLVNLHQQLDSSDAFIFASPEYNGSFAPALKNALDYFKKSTYEKKAVGIASVSMGAMGGMRGAQQMQRQVLDFGALPTPRMLLVGQVTSKVDPTGAIIEERFQSTMDSFLDEFLWLAKALRS